MVLFFSIPSTNAGPVRSFQGVGDGGAHGGGKGNHDDPLEGQQVVGGPGAFLDDGEDDGHHDQGHQVDRQDPLNEFKDISPLFNGMNQNLKVFR